MTGTIHTLADVLHLLAASVWLGALLAFVVLAARIRGHSADGLDAAHRALAGFAGVGTVAVAVLLVTGMVNSWFLIGPDKLGALFTTRYGQLPAIKLALFGFMLGLAAANRYRLVPALARAVDQEDMRASSTARMRRSLAIEATLGVAVIALVGWLGTLPPLIDG